MARFADASDRSARTLADLAVVPASTLGDDFPYVLSVYHSAEYVVNAIASRESVFPGLGRLLERHWSNFGIRRLIACRNYYCLLVFLRFFAFFARRPSMLSRGRVFAP